MPVMLAKQTGILLHVNMNAEQLTRIRWSSNTWKDQKSAKCHVRSLETCISNLKLFVVYTCSAYVITDMW